MIKFFASLLFSVSCLASGEAELTFPSAVEVSPRSEITMYDIVEAKNLNEDISEDLKEITISQRKGNVLSKMELARLLRPVKARFVLPGELKILKSKSAISRMEVERKIKNKIYSQCEICEVQVLISSVPQNLESDWVMDLNIDLNKNNVMIPVFAIRNSSSKGWIVAEIKRYQKVPVLNQSVKVGDVLTEDMFSIEKRQVLNARETFQNPHSLSGMQAVRFLNAGQTVQFRDVKKEQVLKKGQMVKAIAGSSDFEVAISAEAQEAGSVGDVVKIKNLDSQKVFAARVVQRGVVRIE